MTVHQHTREENSLKLTNYAPSKTDYGCRSMRGDILQIVIKKKAEVEKQP